MANPVTYEEINIFTIHRKECITVNNYYYVAYRVSLYNDGKINHRLITEYTITQDPQAVKQNENLMETDLHMETQVQLGWYVYIYQTCVCH